MRKKSVKTIMIDVLYDILGSVLYAAGIYTFAYHANFAPGGISGLSIILNNIYSYKEIPFTTKKEFGSAELFNIFYFILLSTAYIL